jgi:hypothetical protein
MLRNLDWKGIFRAAVNPSMGAARKTSERRDFIYRNL